MDLIPYCDDLARRARLASRQLGGASSAQKNRWLVVAADMLLQRASDVLAANARDLAVADTERLPAAPLDRLRLNSSRIDGIAKGLREIVALPDPVGRILD